VLSIKSQLPLIVLLLLSVVVVTACISQTPSSSSVTPAPVLTTVKVAYMPIISFGPLFIAKEEGYFAQQGINVEFEKFQATSTSLPSLISGDIAVTGGQLFPGLINSISKGANVRIVADKGMIIPGSCNSSAFLVRKDLVTSGVVKTISDLRGRKIAAGSDQSYGTYRALDVGNLTPDDVDTVAMTSSATVVAFENGAIDAGFLMEPYITQAVRNGKTVVFLPGEDFIPNYTTPLYYGTTFTDTNPELGGRFMVAYLQGVRQYNQGKTDRNIEILANYTHLDRDLLVQSCWVPIGESGEIPRQPIREYMDWMYANDKIPQKVDEDQLFDMSYVTYANIVLSNATSGR
jgi:ABC-type nitrate/sulfonate/bicarbonate transport system substrate-binding protein